MATYAMPREEQDLMPNNNNSNNNSNSNNNTNNNYNHNNNDNSAGGRVDLSAQSARSFFSGFPSLSNFFSQSQSQPHLHSQTQRNNARTFFSLNGDDDEEKMLPLSTSYVGSNVDAARSANNGNNNNASGPNLFLHNEEEGKDAADRLLELLKKK